MTYVYIYVNVVVGLQYTTAQSSVNYMSDVALKTKKAKDCVLSL